MLSFRVGYMLILLTPLLSLCAFGLSSGIALESSGLEGGAFTAWNVSILVIWIIGMALYLYGYVRREATDAEATVILLFSFLLIPWAVFTYLFASELYNATVIRIINPGTGELNPGMSPLTMWDHLEYSTWELKAIVWIASGFVLIATSLLKIVTSRLKMHSR